MDAIVACMAAANADFQSTELFLHGSTLAINTIIQRDGAKAALITTRGFRDVYEIGRINRPDAYNLYFRKHRPLIKRSSRYEIAERISAEGKVLTPLDETQLRELATVLRQERFQSVAVMFLHSYANPAHERLAKKFCKRNCLTFLLPRRMSSGRSTANLSGLRRSRLTPTSGRRSASI